MYTRNLNFKTMCNVTINDATIGIRLANFNNNMTLNNVNVKNRLTNRENGTLILNNVTVNDTINNTGKLIIADDVNFESTATIIGSGIILVNNTNMIYPFTNTFNGESTLSNIVIDKVITNNGKLTLNNVTIDNKIINNNQLIISDDCIITDNFILEGNGEVIVNDVSILPSYNGENTFTDKTFTKDKVNYGNLTLNTCNIEKTMTNYGNLTLNTCNITGDIINEGSLTIDSNTIFDSDAKITGNGEIIVSDIRSIISNIPIINGTYNISDATINGNHLFLGNITLNNCTINSDNSSNIGFLYLNNCTATNNNWLTNYLIVVTDEESGIDETINNKGNIYKGTLPEENYYPTKYVINNITASIFFKDNKLDDFINSGSTLDFQGTISGIPGLTAIIIDRPVNILTSTNDGRIEKFSNITYNTNASGSNITGLYTYNTQFYVRNAHNMVFDNISNVVNSSSIGWGVGQTSIGHNSTNITVKNSYFYTKDNGGSSTFVFNWADNSTIENCTVVGEGNVGNLVYLTTYNVNIPSGVTPNSNNRILNNTVTGPSRAAAICYAIAISGVNNLIDGNNITYTGTGITGQWGSGVTGNYNEESLIGIYNNTVSNNNLYGGCGISAGNFIYNNYVQSGVINIDDGRVYNNTANTLNIGGNKTEIYNNTITGTTKVLYVDSYRGNRTYSLIEKNTLNSIQIEGNNTLFKNNNITGTITGNRYTSNYTFQDNNIENNINIQTQATQFTFENNNITGRIDLFGNTSTWKNNNITGNINIGDNERNNNQFTFNNITGNIYINSSWYATGNKIINNNVEGYVEIITNQGCANTVIENNTIISPETYHI